MKKFNKVAIVGVGEIGGSIGKCLRTRGLAKEIIGIGRRISSLKKAKRVGAVDRFYLINKLKEALKDVDFIILATPVCKIVPLGKKAIFYAKKGALITDVGSTKKYIVEELEKRLSNRIKFIGSHPMAGTEKGGPLSSDKDLFKGRDCFVTKTKNTDKNALKIIKKFWKVLGANPIEISLSDHDRIVASISQMVHIVASSLVIANRNALNYAASGFRDTTRIALSDPTLWRDICLTNNKNISKSLNELIKILKKFNRAISQNKVSTVTRLLEDARRLRKKV